MEYLFRLAKVFQHKTNQYTIKRLIVEWQACRNVTFRMPTESAILLASLTDASHKSTEVNAESGFMGAIIFVCAPTPHPASSTKLLAGNTVSP